MKLLAADVDPADVARHPMRVMCRIDPVGTVRAMWFPGLIALYLVLALTLGLMTFRRGHVVLFWVGIFFPICWLIGAILPPKAGHDGGTHQSTDTQPEHHGRVTG